MNKVFKIIWSEARNAYVVVSEIAKNMGGKGCSTKKLLAMLLATGVMTCAGLGVSEAAPSAATTAAYQYVATKAVEFTRQPTQRNKDTWGGYTTYNEAITEYNAQKNGSKTIGKYTYNYDTTNKYWVRDGYVLTIEEDGGKYTPLSANAKRADVAHASGDKTGILEAVTSTISANGTVTNIGEALNKVTPGTFSGVSHTSGTEVPGDWNYIIQDSSWKGHVDSYEDGYADLVGKLGTAFKTTQNSQDLKWDESQQAYTYKGVEVDYDNMYVIDGKLGVFTNYDGSAVYTGTVYGKNNEILMTVKDGDHFYSYWAASVTDPGTTMQNYYVDDYKKDLATLEGNDNKLYRNDIKKVDMTTGANTATFKLLRNGDTAAGIPVDGGAITITAGGGSGGSGAANDTWVKVANGEGTSQTFATGTKVEAIGTSTALTGIKINGTDYALNGKAYTAGANVQISADNVISATDTQYTAGANVQISADNVISATDTTYTAGKNVSISADNVISVADTKYTAGANVQISDDNVISATDTIYTAGNGIAVTGTANAISVKLKEGEGNLVVDRSGLSLKKNLEVDSVNAGGTVIDSSGLSIGQKTYVSSSGLNANSQRITNVAAGEVSAKSTDAINGSQLQATNDRVQKVEGDITNINADITDIKDNITTINSNIDNINTEINNIQGDITEIKGDITTINNKVNANTEKIEQNAQKIEQNTQNITKLDNRVTEVEKVAGKHSTVTEGDNITVTEGANSMGGKDYTVALKKDIALDSVATGAAVMNNDGFKVGADVSVTKDAVTAGTTSISGDGLKIGDNTYVSKDGLNANSQRITNVAAGEAATDAVNVSQLQATNEQVINNSNRISRLGDRVNKVGAGAAALAALHPMDFDPDDKWSFAAGYGNYAGQNAAAIGAYYRPDEKVMFSVGGTVGNGENMVNAGVSFALDRTSHVSNSRTAMAREIVDLRGQLTLVTAELASLKATLGVIDESKTKLFADVPSNHWAYEYISKLAGNGYIEGYPDGNFDGNRLMTRYEIAAMLYRAMEKGAALEEKIINEFAPELGRIRVERISGKDGDRNKIERVRVNGPQNERDHYGSRLK